MEIQVKQRPRVACILDPYPIHSRQAISRVTAGLHDVCKHCIIYQDTTATPHGQSSSGHYANLVREQFPPSK